LALIYRSAHRFHGGRDGAGGGVFFFGNPEITEITNNNTRKPKNKNLASPTPTLTMPLKAKNAAAIASSKNTTELIAFPF